MTNSEIDTLLFIEIISGIPGVHLLHHDVVDGEKIEIFLGLRGQKVFINITDEFMPKKTAHDYLKQLGLDYLIGKI